MNGLYRSMTNFIKHFSRIVLLNCLILGIVHNGQIHTFLNFAETGPTIHDFTPNESDYPSSQVPQYEKFEITFQVDTEATNVQLPYYPTPPAGIQPGTGISVDAQFSNDNWQTVYTQPAFYYQDFADEIKSGQEWYYPTGNYSWKVRFTPNQSGTWQYKIIAQDSSGTTETTPRAFIVVPSTKKGLIRVSQNDPRYFEFDNGTYFPGLGYNMNYDHISWNNPILDNEDNFQIMSQNGIQLVRIWLSQWGIYGPMWNPWNSIDPNQHGDYFPQTGLTFEQAFPGSEVSMKIDASYNPCMFIGVWKAKPAVKKDTNYRIRIRYKTTNIIGPRNAGHPYGFVAKTGDWLWGPGNYCYDSDTGTSVTTYQNQNTGVWEILEGSLNTGNNDFLPNFYLVMENVNQGVTYVDYVWVEEDLGNGNYGPNIISKPWMAHHQYMEQRNSYAFDKLLDLAKQYDIYLKIVIHEKHDWILNRFDFQGNPIPDDPLCWDSDPNNDPQECPGNQWFYGNWREMTKVRWLQQAWWRYLQARWGYSPNIHSWELLNEGDPWDSSHYTLADELGKYMHLFRPDDHLVTTSFWHSFPKETFWANPDYPNVDYADYHRYIEESEPFFTDTALATYDPSLQYGAIEPGGTGKPVIRGETGFVVSGSEPPTDQFQNDTEGIWLHNFIWGGINAGGLLESYWYENIHIYNRNSNSTYNFDYRDHYRPYYNFIKDIPLNNGHYHDVEASVSNDNLRAWGQKDLLNGNAYLWIQNTNHTWKNVVDGVPIPTISGIITIAGFQPLEKYTIQWWDPYQTDPSIQIIKTETVTAQTDGQITLSIENLSKDMAVKVYIPHLFYLPLLRK